METFDFKLTQVSKTFENDVQAISTLDFSVDRGEFVSILGPSGSGKSTLLKLVAGLQSATTGKIEFANTDSRRFGFVFQEAELLPWRTALENVTLPLELLRMKNSQCKEKAEKALHDLGLEEFIHAFPSELSGGMKMRVSLARALVTDPQILLLDEPFAALDEITRQRLDEDLRNFWIQRKITVLFVTHSVEEAVFLSNRALIFSRRPARLLGDVVVSLPLERTRRLKSDPAFSKQVEQLSQLLEQTEERLKAK